MTDLNVAILQNATAKSIVQIKKAKTSLTPKKNFILNIRRKTDTAKNWLQAKKYAFYQITNHTPTTYNLKCTSTGKK